MTDKTQQKPKREDYEDVMEYYAAYRAWSKARAKKSGDMSYDETKKWEDVEKFATQFVKDVTRDPDEPIRKELDTGIKYTPKKRKKQIK